MEQACKNAHTYKNKICHAVQSYSVYRTCYRNSHLQLQKHNWLSKTPYLRKQNPPVPKMESPQIQWLSNTILNNTCHADSSCTVTLNTNLQTHGLRPNLKSYLSKTRHAMLVSVPMLIKFSCINTCKCYIQYDPWCATQFTYQE